MKMKIRLLRSLEIVGIFLLLFSFLLGFVGVEIVNISFNRMDLVHLAVGFCGILVFIVSSSAIGYEKNKTREQQIEEKDESIISIHQIAKYKTCDLIATSFHF